MHLMKSSFDDPMAAVPSLQHRVMPDHLRCRGGSTCDRLQWSHWLALAPVASFFTQKSHAAIGRSHNALIAERSRRLWAATEARAIGWGGVSLVAEATGMARNTIAVGIRELSRRGRRSVLDQDRVRRAGGGRKRLTKLQPKLVSKLEALVEPTTRGDPHSPLRWTTLRVRKLEEALRKDGFTVSYVTVASLLKKLNYTLQGNFKRSEGAVDHTDRDAQFRYINDQAVAQLRARRPVISVDTKKKELVGAYKNAGREWRPKGDPIEVLTHDFPDPEVPKAVPYGIYDIGENKGWVNVGMSVSGGLIPRRIGDDTRI